MKAALLVLCLAGALAGPVVKKQHTECAQRCTGSAKFAYEAGKTYEFTYETDVKTHLQGATEEHSSLHIRATADVEVITKCEFALRVSDVSLLDSKPSQYDDRQEVAQSAAFKELMEANPVRFSFQDGRVEEVCPADGEDVRALNIKRGILSAFQNSMHKFDDHTKSKETDVAGDCDTEYKVTDHGFWGSITINKTKDIMACTRRHGHITALQGSRYNVPSAIQSLPLMKTWHSCEQTISAGKLLHKSVCNEEHVFRPFSKQQNGAATHVSQVLTFVKEKGYIKADETLFSRHTSLAFEHVHKTSANSNDKSDIEATLNDICQFAKDDIRPEIPGIFAQLVYNIRDLDLQTLRKVHQRIHAGKICKKSEKYFMDAIPMAGSTSSVGLIVDLISKKKKVPTATLR